MPYYSKRRVVVLASLPVLLHCGRSYVVDAWSNLSG